MYAKPSTFAARDRLSPRAEASRNLVELTFRGLIAQKCVGEISMKELADAAGVARSTVYRRWAGVEQLVWDLMRPCMEMGIRSACVGDVAAAADQLEQLWETKGLLPALQDQRIASAIRRHLETVIAAEIERLSRHGRPTATCALLLASSLLAFLLEFGSHRSVERAQLEELIFVFYVSAFMTPAALKAAARDHRLARTGQFPPAVSVRESLASDEYIVSMIDGRPYRSLTRHISRYGMTPDDYRRCFNLDDTYPMVAKRYSERRRQIAQQVLIRKLRGEETGRVAA